MNLIILMKMKQIFPGVYSVSQVGGYYRVRSADGAFDRLFLQVNLVGSYFNSVPIDILKNDTILIFLVFI